MKSKNIIRSLKFNSSGLIPAVIQDCHDNKVLMVAYMNRQSLLKTLSTKRTWFYSRKRAKLWMKGETSGNIQKVKSIFLDCDNDCILVKVEQIGRKACHTGHRSCFYTKVYNLI